jgi:hypothetical protein
MTKSNQSSKGKSSSSKSRASASKGSPVPAKGSPTKAKRETYTPTFNASLFQHDEVVSVMMKGDTSFLAFYREGRQKAAFTHPVTEAIKKGDARTSKWGINHILPLRESVESNHAMLLDGYAIKVLIKHWPEGTMHQRNVELHANAVVHDMNKAFNKDFKYPPRFNYVGDETGDKKLPWEHHFLNEDVIKMANFLYRSAIKDGSFFEDTEAVEDVFLHAEDATDRFYV